MKRFMFILALGLAAADKLDRTYLPPPGSKYAGGQHGDLQVPLEFPKESYTTTAPFTPGQNNEGSVTIGDSQIDQEAAQIPGSVYSEQLKDLVPVQPANKSPFNFFQNSNKVPTTTTSYAFTQTTTFAPPEGFETTPSPFGSGYPIDGTLNQQPDFLNQPFDQGQIFNQQTGQFYPKFIQPGYKIPQGPGSTPGSSIPGAYNSFPGNLINSGHPGYTETQNFNQYQQGLPGPTISSVPGSSFQPGLITSNNQGISQHQSVQPPRQFIQQGLIPSTTARPGYQSSYPSQDDNVLNIQEAKVTGQQSPISPIISPQQEPTQYIDKFGNIQSTVPGFTADKQQYGGNLNSISASSGPIISLKKDAHRPQSIQGTVTGFVPGQQQKTGHHEFSGQPGYHKPEQYQVTNIPELPRNVQQGQSQQIDSLLPYLPGQGNQSPQYQQTFPSSGFPQAPIVDYSQRDQRPQFGGQQNIYPSVGNSQAITPDSITQQQVSGKQPQFTGQQGSFSSTFNPQEQVINRESQQVRQPLGQQSIFPSTGVPQGSSTFRQTASQLSDNEPKITGQSFSMPSKLQPEFYQQSENVNNFQKSNISRSNALPGASRILSQPSVTQRYKDKNIVTSSPRNIYGTSTTRPITSLPFNYQQPSSPSTLNPSTFASFHTTHGSIDPSSIPSYPGANSLVISSLNARGPERPEAELDRNAVILNFESVLTPEGYAYSFDTSNGIHADENGTTIDGVKANGSYSYIGDDGKLYSVVYTADENGFRPRGDHLPTPPPIPKAIQRVIEQVNKDKEAGIFHDGFYDEDKYGHKKYQGHKNRRPGKQNKIINGVDVPDDFENSNNVKIPGRKGERKPITSTSENNPDDYDDTVYNSEDDISEMGQNIKKQPNKKIPSRLPKPNTSGQVENKNEQNKELVTGIDDQMPIYPISQQMQHRKLIAQNSPKRRLFSPGRKTKPVPSRAKYIDEENDNGKKIVEDNDGFSKKTDKILYEKDRREPLKSTEKKFEYSSKLPELFSFEENTDTKRIHEVKRPVLSNSEIENSSYKLKQTINNDNKPKSPSKVPSETFGTKYYVTDNSSKEQEEYEEPSQSDEEKYTVNNRKGTQKMGSTKYKFEQDSNQRPGTDSQKSYVVDTNKKGSRFEQEDRPSNAKSTKDSDRQYSNISNNEENGYIYTPPQSKVNQEEIKRFPPRFSEKAGKKPPVTEYSIEDKKTTAQPFITPNVHRDEDDSYEDVSEENSIVPKRPGNPSKEINPENYVTSTAPEYEYETTDISSEYFDKQNEPEHDKGDIVLSKINSARPEKIGSTRHDYPSQQTTGRPEYDEYTITDDEQEVPPRGFTKPGQKNYDRYPLDSSKETPQGRPLQINLKTTEKSKKPTYISFTTPMQFRKSNRPGSKRPSQEEEEQFQYTTTYKPTDISNNGEEYTDYTTRPRLSNKTFTPNVRLPVSKPMADDSSDSTKIPPSGDIYEPSFVFTDEATLSGSPMVRPGISESTFGRHSTNPTGSKIPAYSTVMPISKVSRLDTGAPIRPGITYDKSKPGSVTLSSTSRTPDRMSSNTVTGRPDASQTSDQSGPQFLPSTTYRPNYSITDISEPGSVTVDAFGRPLQPVVGTRQPVAQSLTETTTIHFPVSASQETPTGQKNIYQDSGVTHPGQQVYSFKPTEPRYGGPVQETPGTKPAEFGPSSVTTPGYLSPYGHPTEKVIGEDFSGPKQQQKFDAETGYYY